MVRWHGGISKHQRAATAPQAAVFFDRLNQDLEPQGKVRIEVGLPHLGALRIGSIWCNGSSSSQVKLDRFDAAVDFSSGGWNFVSARDFHEKNHSSLLPAGLFSLPYGNGERSWLLEFFMADGATLLVPSLEFFTRCYARTAEVNRVIATYPWEEVERRLFKPVTEPVELGTWPVKLCARVYSADAVFLAHVLHDPVARHAAKNIYAQLDANFQANSGPAFLRAGPWHDGPATLIVEGLRLDARRFLGLRILGCSDPMGVPIVMDRENAANAKNPAPDDASEIAWAGAPVRSIIGVPEIIDLTDDDDPDHSSPTLELNDPDFIVPGVRRIVRTVHRKQATSQAGPRGSDDGADTYSAGERYGATRNTGLASIHSDCILESQGTLRDVWNALVHLKGIYPSIIKSVDWCTPTAGFSDAEEPAIVGLQPFGVGTNPKLPPSIQNWPYIDADIRQLRGVLVARVKTVSAVVYVLEIQRRSRSEAEDAKDAKDANAQVSASEESFQGLVALAEEGEALDVWLPAFLDRIRHARGVVKQVLDVCPASSAGFNHTSSKKDEVPMQAAVRNALRKVGIELSR